MNMETHREWTILQDGQYAADMTRAFEKERRGRIGPIAKGILMKSRGKPDGVKIVRLGIVRGEELGSCRYRTTERFLREARRRSFAAPTPDFALLLKAQLPEELSLLHGRLIIGHKPVRDAEHHPTLLAICREENRNGLKRDSILALEAYPFTMWKASDAFVFIAPPETFASTIRPRAFERTIGGISRRMGILPLITAANA